MRIFRQTEEYDFLNKWKGTRVFLLHIVDSFSVKAWVLHFEKYRRQADPDGESDENKIAKTSIKYI